MDRYGPIRRVSFAGVELPLPLQARVRRAAKPEPLAGAADAWTTSVQTRPPALSAEVALRGTAAAEGLTLGTRAALELEIGGTRADQPARTVRLSGAVLVDVEIEYAQNTLASVLLRFVVEAANGQSNPYTAEDAP